MTKKGGGRPGDDILDELNSVSSLLGDAERDVDPDGMDDGGVPLLEPEASDAGDGDAHTQIPLLGADDPDKPAAPKDLKKELAARDNPFLPRKQIDELAKSRQQASEVIANTPAPSPSAGATPPKALPDEQVRQAVDAVLAEWMPRLEADLRARLTRLLKS
ncbi:MAG: hypothetical protein ACPG43_10325 [Alcanivoracaceae bacterium]